jgi:hypothetical protein
VKVLQAALITAAFAAVGCGAAEWLRLRRVRRFGDPQILGGLRSPRRRVAAAAAFAVAAGAAAALVAASRTTSAALPPACPLSVEIAVDPRLLETGGMEAAVALVALVPQSACVSVWVLGTPVQICPETADHEGCSTLLGALEAVRTPSTPSPPRAPLDGLAARSAESRAMHGTRKTVALVREPLAEPSGRAIDPGILQLQPEESGGTLAASQIEAFREFVSAEPAAQPRSYPPAVLAQLALAALVIEAVLLRAGRRS